MRVCIIAKGGYPHGIGGMQRHTTDLAEGLARAGHEVEVITRAHPEGLRESRRNDVRWHFVASADRGSGRRILLRQLYERFVALHDRNAFDVVHSESEAGVDLLKNRVDRTVPVVVMFHGVFLGLLWASLKRGFRERTVRGAARELKAMAFLVLRHAEHGNWYRYRHCEAIIQSRHQLRSTQLSCLLDSTRVHVVPTGVNAELFAPRPREEARRELGLDSGLLFSCLGRLHFEKGTHHAIEALSRLDVDSRLVIVGDGPERERLHGLAVARGIADRVTIVHEQPEDVDARRREVATYLAATDVFLFPTERDEAFGLIVPEAMACATPVIASRIGAIPEIIDWPGVNGILVRPGDADELATAMHALAEDAELRRRMGEAARERVLERFTLETMTASTVEVYRIAAARLGRTVS
jgi:glycosyltransferase involved in cell wall biosynthesis